MPVSGEDFGQGQFDESKDEWVSLWETICGAGSVACAAWGRPCLIVEAHKFREAIEKLRWFLAVMRTGYMPEAREREIPSEEEQMSGL